MAHTEIRKGFTLVEMTIVLVLIGLIAGTVLPMIVRSIKQEKISEGKRLVRTVREELVGYAVMHKALPDSLDAVGHSEDPWRGELHYRFASGLDAHGSLCASSTNSTDLSVVQSGKTIDDVAFVVASRGENYNLQITQGGGSVTIHEQGQSVDGYAAGGDPNRVEEFDDIVEYVTLGYLKAKACSPVAMGASQTNPPGAQISFDQNMLEFPVDLAAMEDSNTMQVDTAARTISMGNGLNQTWGCLWYRGDTAGCADGICSLGDGMRAFFRFAFREVDTSADSRDFADGFTFALIGADANGPGVCGGSSSRGEYLGYAGSNGESPSIAPPKIATEFDIYPNGRQQDFSDNNHVAFVYWGERSNQNDDVRHGNGASPDPRNPPGGSSGYVTSPAAVTWMEDASQYSFRLEINRSQNSREYTIRAWVDCEDCEDLRTPFSGPDPITDSFTLEAIDHADLDSIRFGWTLGTGGRTQAIVISDFGIRFLP